MLRTTALSLCSVLLLTNSFMASAKSSYQDDMVLPLTLVDSMSKIQPFVPTLAYDDHSVVLAWSKPDDTHHEARKIVDFKVYQNEKFIGLASENNKKFNPAADYIESFYDQDKDNFHTKIVYLNYKVTQLQADTRYKFRVIAVYDDGSESKKSRIFSITTVPAFKNVVDITDYGAKGDGNTVNTKAIQKAIDDCSAVSSDAYGCKVVVPAGKTFVTGALFLKSNMTFEVQKNAILKGSTHAEDYPLNKGYQLYSYQTSKLDSRRPPSLLNVLSEDHQNGTAEESKGYDGSRHVFQNIRVVGEGTLDGSGWERSATGTKDEAGKTLAYFPRSNRTSAYRLGVLAADQLRAAWKTYDSNWRTQEELLQLIDDKYDGLDASPNKDFYSNRRSSLATFRGVDNVYFGGLTLLNPALHGPMFIESENVVFAYTNTQTFDANNADGVEFGNTKNSAVIANFIDSGDDCINFAAGQGEGYVMGAESTEKSWIINNYTREGHGSVVAGSHTAAWIQDILAEDNVAFLTDRGLRMKSTTNTGGGARRIVYRDNALKNIGTFNSVEVNGVTIENRGGLGETFVATLAYKSGGSNDYKAATVSAQFSDIRVDNVTVDNIDPSSGKYSILIEGYDGSGDAYPVTYHKNFVFKHVKLKRVKATKVDYLDQGLFSDIVFSDWEEGKDSPWQITHSKDITFTDVTPEHQDIP